MDICRLFHKKSKKRKEQKILLITQSFPQSPQVFPQGFSTGGACCGYAVLVHIKRSDTLRRISHFSAGRGFYHEHFFVQKLGLDNSPCRPRRPPTGAGWPGRSFLRPERQKILKKGLILSRQGVIMRICMENEQKEVESMPHIKPSSEGFYLTKRGKKVNIDNLTIGEAKQIAAIFNATQAQSTPSPMIGRKCVVRACNAGVHFGTVSAHDGQQVVLTDARRIHYWEKAFTLSAVAKHGIGGDSRISCVVPEILLTDALELIPMSEKSIKSLEGASVHLGEDDD